MITVLENLKKVQVDERIGIIFDRYFMYVLQSAF